MLVAYYIVSDIFSIKKLKIIKMKTNKFFALTIFLGLFFSSCSSDNEDFTEKNEIDDNLNSNPVTTQPASELDVESFFYRGMSDIYLYKKDVAVLADGYFESEADKTRYLENFSSPEALFKKLVASQDKFSYVIDDYRELNRMASGTENMHGMSYGLVSYCNTCPEVLGYVRFVYPNTSAAENGVKRGMIFNRIDGQQLTKSNLNELLGSSNFSIGLAKIEDNTVSNLDETIPISLRESVKNPVIVSKVLDINGNKVGYLNYDSFTAGFDEELNDVFTDFKSKGVKELVLDLRYNGGGSVRTATDLASMITGQFLNQLFMKEEWNEKYQSYYEQNDPQSLLNNFNSKIRTGTEISSLNLNRVFVLTTKSSASASELIINGLEPYIEVVQIGDVTTGKFQASVAIYDSPDFNKSNSSLNTSHFYALQPLILKSLNADNVSDYVNGLNPDITYKEDITNLGELGHTNEPLLKIALDVIQGNRVSISQPKIYPEVGESDMFRMDYQKMYLDNEDLPAIKD